MESTKIKINNDNNEQQQASSVSASSSSSSLNVSLDNRRNCRRRSLFPSTSVAIEDDAELGRIAPLPNTSSDSDCDQDNELDISNYNIMEVIQDKSSQLEFLYESIPQPSVMENMNKTNEEINNLTPHHNANDKYLSPTQNLKTPHVEISNVPATASSSLLFIQHSCKEVKVIIEKPKSLKRSHLKCESSDEEEDEHQEKKTKGCLNLNSKNSKVRTALFPDDDYVSEETHHESMENVQDANNSVLKNLQEQVNDIEISTKSFYSSSPTVSKIHSINRNSLSSKFPIFGKRRSGGGASRKRNSGEINRGVRHKIRKPLKRKQNKIKEKTSINKKLENGRVLNDYIKDILELKNENVKLISTTATNTPPAVNLKENHQETSVSNSSSFSYLRNVTDSFNKPRKFFKCSQANVKSIENEQKSLNPNIEKEAKRPLSAIQQQPVQNELQLQQSLRNDVDEIINDFQDDLDLNNTINNIIVSIDEKQQNETVVVNDSASSQLPLTILSPISQMCDVTSGLALNSPKKNIRNLTPVLNSMTNSNNKENQQQQLRQQQDGQLEKQSRKFYPLFYQGFKGASSSMNQKRKIELNLSSSADTKKFKSNLPDQWLLDAGQKNVGYTHCAICNIFYYKGDPGDEIVHRKYHNIHNILRFNGWKNERVVADYQINGRIIKILFNDSKSWLNKVKEVIGVIQRELGEIQLFDDDDDLHSTQVYFYVRNRLIIGCAVATMPRTRKAYKILSNINNILMCTKESCSIKCGITTIWVMENYRKEGIGTALLNAIKANFLFGTVLTNDDLALSSPTEAGSEFAKKYFKKHDYLVY